MSGPATLDLVHLDENDLQRSGPKTSINPSMPDKSFDFANEADGVNNAATNGGD